MFDELARQNIEEKDAADLLEENQKIIFGVTQGSHNLDSLIAQLLLNDSSLAKKVADNLLRVELLLFYSIGPVDHSSIQLSLKCLESLLSKPEVDDNSNALFKVKYHDLLTDYQFCFTDSTKRLRLVDLINKKLNFLKSICGNEPLVHDIQLKILLLYILSEADLRKRNIYQYLKEEGVFSRGYPVPIKEYVLLSTGSRLMSISAFNNLTEHLLAHFPFFKHLLERHHVQLLEYYLENNIQRLPRYFKSIRLVKIPLLLCYKQEEVDIEDLVFRMIVGKQLPEGTRIDQLQEMVFFGPKVEKYDSMNTRMKRVCEMVDSLAIH